MNKGIFFINKHFFSITFKLLTYTNKGNLDLSQNYYTSINKKKKYQTDNIDSDTKLSLLMKIFIDKLSDFAALEVYFEVENHR